MTEGERVGQRGGVSDCSRPPLVYVAGPISGNPFGAVREVIPVWRHLRSLGVAPFCPQWSILPEMIEQIDYETWLAYDLDIIRNCDAVIRLPGVSPGADREMEFAGTLHMDRFWLPVEWPMIERWAAKKRTTTPVEMTT